MILCYCIALASAGLNLLMWREVRRAYRRGVDIGLRRGMDIVMQMVLKAGGQELAAAVAVLGIAETEAPKKGAN